MMRIKNSQMVGFMNGTVEIKKKILPIKVGYAIRKNLKLLEPIAAAYEEERTKILDKYIVKDEDGNYVVKDGSYVASDEAEYNREMQELLEIENEIALHTVPFSELEKCDLDKFDALSVHDLEILEFMTTE